MKEAKQKDALAAERLAHLVDGGEELLDDDAVGEEQNAADGAEQQATARHDAHAGGLERVVAPGARAAAATATAAVLGARGRLGGGAARGAAAADGRNSGRR